jgi:hypothetical protein
MKKPHLPQPITRTTLPPDRLPYPDWIRYIYEQSRKREGVEAVIITRQYD